MHPAGLDDDFASWRRRKRAELLALRGSLARDTFEYNSELVLEQVADLLEGRATGTLGFCWPFRVEINLINLVERSISKGWAAALPMVVAKGQPLEFRRWKPGDPMTPGVFDIPYPTEAFVVRPDVLLVPVVGYDEECYRLGYGGGYFDRTLASLTPKPFAIGVGFESARLETIYPQPFDVPMDCIVTEAATRWRSGLAAAH